METENEKKLRELVEWLEELSFNEGFPLHVRLQATEQLMMFYLAERK